MSRVELRKHMRHRRRTLTKAERAEYAQRCARRVTSLPLFRSSLRIACYLPFDGELDPYPLMRRAWEMRKLCYLPVVRGKRLWFASYGAGDRLVKNRFGIAEPRASRHTLIRPARLDVVLTPLVAFDNQGNRLGMGAGFYDRTFAFLKHCGSCRRPRLIGLAYDFQRVAHIEAEAWDVPLHVIVTEARLYKAR